MAPDETSYNVNLTLDDIAEEIVLGSRDATVYFNIRTGQCTCISELAMTDDELEQAMEEAGAEEDLIPRPVVESNTGYRWMAEFTDNVADERLKAQLMQALQGRGAFRRFKDVLMQWPAEREQWSSFEWKKILAM